MIKNCSRIVFLEMGVYCSNKEKKRSGVQRIRWWSKKLNEKRKKIWEKGTGDAGVVVSVCVV